MKAFVIQCGRRCVKVGGGGLKGFSRICSDVGFDHSKYSDGMFGVLCCEIVCIGLGYFELYYCKGLEDLGTVMRVY